MCKKVSIRTFNTFFYLSIKPQSFKQMINFLLQQIGI